MKTYMVVNRNYNWFQITDVELDVALFAMKLLEKLNNRRIAGLDYDRLKLSSIISKRSSSESIDMIDKTIVALLSRGLIEIKYSKQLYKKIFISEFGITALNNYREALK